MTALAMKANLHNDNGDWQIKGSQETQINQNVAGGQWSKVSDFMDCHRLPLMFIRSDSFDHLGRQWSNVLDFMDFPVFF